MKIGSISENLNFEKRIAITPDIVKKYSSIGLEVILVENYGKHLGINDNEFVNLGAKILKDDDQILSTSDLIVQLGLPFEEKFSVLKENQNLIGILNPYENKEKLNQELFVKANDFFRINEQLSSNNVYHHIGIYAFTNEALLRYVSLKRSKLELERKLEQLRAIENSMTIHVGYINSSPLSVDTKNDLISVRKMMEKNEKN